MKPAFRKPLLCILVLCSIALFAQSRPTPRFMHTTEKSKVHTPAQIPSGLQTIYSNLGPSTDAYNGENGAVVAGSASSAGISFSYAVPFTPKSDAHVRQIQAPLSYLLGSDGANQVNISIYSDASGVPGTLLAGPIIDVNLPSFGSCCGLAGLYVTPPLPVTAGTRYWIVADTPTTGTGDDFYGVWCFYYKTPFLQASNVGGFGWNQTYGGYEEGAVGVFGSIP
jgi:hypothetical protein